MAVRIMKHHRDVMFEGREDAPISIIITTLAALSYDQTAGVFDTLADVLSKMDSHIDRSNGSYVIKSPVDERENYADKWNEDPRKARAFYEWLESARRDLVQAPLTLDGIDEIGKSLKGHLAERAVTSAITRLGEGLREARDGGRLYATAAAGITLSTTAGAVPVRSHTFYGA